MKKKVVESIRQLKSLYGIDYMVSLYSDKGIQQIAEIIAYRVQKAQYELLCENGCEFSWNEYLVKLCCSKTLMKRACSVAVQAQKAFWTFQFDAEISCEKTVEQKRIVRLFSEEMAKAIVVLFQFKAEIKHHEWLCSMKGEGYTLAQFIEELGQNEVLAAAQRRCFENAIMELDFRAAWIKEGFMMED